MANLCLISPLNVLGRGLLFVLLTWLTCTVNAATEQQYRMQINIAGKVKATETCTFNQSGTIMVDFGDVRYSTITGGNTLEGIYRKPLASEITCTGDSNYKAHMKFASNDGDSLTFNNHLLLPVKINSKAQEQDLGIRLLVNGSPQDINTEFEINTANPPELVAELVQTGSGNTFASGAKFTASASLTISFD